jgi:hypothetical protein
MAQLKCAVFWLSGCWLAAGWLLPAAAADPVFRACLLQLTLQLRHLSLQLRQLSCSLWSLRGV